MRPFLFITSLLLLVAGGHSANLTWTPETGYTSDEVELSGLLPEEIQKIQRWMNQGRAAEEKGNFRKALRNYKRVHKRFPKSQYAPESLYRTALIRLEQNKIDRAFEAFELVAWVYPNYGSFNNTVGEMYKIAVRRMESYRVKILGVLPGFLNRDRAIAYFERIIQIAPYSDYAPLSLMNIAQIWAIKKNDTMAIFALDRLITNYPNHFLTADAYLKLAETHKTLVRGPYYDQGNTEDAITYFEDFLIQFPQNKDVGVAEEGLAEAQNVLALSKLKIGDFYLHRRSNFHAAKVFYNEAITIAPTSQTAEVAREKLGEIEDRIAKMSPEEEEKAPTLEEMQKRAEKRAKRKILGVF